MNIYNIFVKCPEFVKRILINVEAINRDRLRQSSGYKDLKKNVVFNNAMSQTGLDEQAALICEQIINATKNIPAYKDKEYKDLSQFPIIDKAEVVRQYRDYLNVNNVSRDCHLGKTSGSTGTPFHFMLNKEAVMKSRLYAEKYIEFLGGAPRKIPTVRISGVRLVPPEKTKPPFWVFIDKYKQLQCSAYHINNDSAKYYIEAMLKYKVKNGTGYPSAWYFLARCVADAEIKAPKLDFIVMDSEKMSEDERSLVEDIFNCKVYMTYGLSEIAQSAVECRCKHYHIVPQLVYAETKQFDGYSYDEGEGEIILTSLSTKYTPLIRYRTGDLGILHYEPCECGWKSPYFEKITGRVEDYILFKGKKIRRLGFIMSSAKHITVAQLVQTSPDSLLIRIIPAQDFTPEDMEESIKVAHQYIGDINVSWEIADALEKTSSGKIKYVIRKV